MRRARRSGADLIVAECMPGRRIAPMLLRLTDWELLRLSPVPVLVVKSAKPYHHPAILAAIDPTHAHAKPTRLDDEILSAGAAIQYALRGKLHAVHAYVPAMVGATPYDILDADVAAQLQERVKADAPAGFDRALRKANIPRSRRHLIGRHPQDAIPRTARKTGSAIVVMGAISRSGLKRIFIGNTAEQLLDDLTCDVLVVKPKQFANRVAAAKRGLRLIAPQPTTSSLFGY
jgi:universal stress protein E